MSGNRQRLSGLPSHDGDAYYSTLVSAGRWLLPVFWLAVVLLAGLFWFA